MGIHDLLQIDHADLRFILGNCRWRAQPIAAKKPGTSNEQTYSQYSRSCNSFAGFPEPAFDFADTDILLFLRHQIPPFSTKYRAQ